MKLRTIFLAVIAGISLQHSLAQSSSITNRQVLKSNDISFEDILFWVGEGSNKSIFIVNWCSPEIAFAWGYRFSEDSVLVSKIIEDIAAADSRIVFTDGGGFITNITYKDSVYNLGLSGDFWMYNVNEGAATGVGSQYIHNEDIVEFGDESCGISDTNWVYVWDIVITPVSKPNKVISNDISFEDILFWVGEGSNQSIFIVNWCSPEIAFAWGYRFSEDSVLVSKIIEDIAAADSRIVFTDGGGYITNITYKDSIYDLGLSGDFWMYNVNEGWATGIGLQYIHNEDIVEFGDESCGISDTNWIYVWDIVITPVSKPNDVAVQNVKFDNMHIAIYPNPTSQNINLNIQNVKEDVRVDIVDINGKILYSEKIAVDNQQIQSISLEKFSKGLYFIRFQGSSFNKTEKIIIY